MQPKRYVFIVCALLLAGTPALRADATDDFVTAQMNKFHLPAAPTNVTPTLPNRARGFTGNDNQGGVAPDWRALRPSGAFLSTVLDLAKWDAALYTNNIVTESSRRQMWEPVRLTDGTSAAYGFGWHVETWKEFGRFVWHGGGLPGFSAYSARFLDSTLSVVVLTNGDDADTASIAIGVARLHGDPRP